MPTRHVLTLPEQIRGLRAAIASPRTPPQLRSALKDRIAALQTKLEQQNNRRANPRNRRKPGLLDFLGL